MATTKIYRNTTKQTVNILGVGEIAAGEQVSVTSDYQPTVILENYPGVLDVSDEQTEVKEKKNVERN